MHDRASNILSQPALVAFWDFQEAGGTDRIAKGPHSYRLTEMAGPIERVEGGVFGKYAAHVTLGQWWNLPRALCPALDFRGQEAKLTIIAWIQWGESETAGCQAVAGMWNETEERRQYCLFLNLNIWDSKDQVCGHVSSVGGPTSGYAYCMTSSIGSTPVSKGEWHSIAFTYDGTYAKSFLDGKLDHRDTYNPFFYDEGLYEGGVEGADFTVAAVNRAGEMGNFFTGVIGGLAVFSDSLNDEQIAEIFAVKSNN